MTGRDDVFAPTPSPLSVRGLLLYAAWFDLRVETGDLACAFMQADSSCEMFARPSKGRDGWIWRLHGAMNGMRTASRDFTEFLAGILTEHMGFKRGKLERCLFVHESNETRVVSHADDAQIDRYWPDQHCTGTTGMQERHLRDDGVVGALGHFQGRVHSYLCQASDA